LWWLWWLRLSQSSGRRQGKQSFVCLVAVVVVVAVLAHTVRGGEQCLCRRVVFDVARVGGRDQGTYNVVDLPGLEALGQLVRGEHIGKVFHGDHPGFPDVQFLARLQHVPHTLLHVVGAAQGCVVVAVAPVGRHSPHHGRS